MGVAPEVGQSGLDGDDVVHVRFVCHRDPSIAHHAPLNFPIVIFDSVDLPESDVPGIDEDEQATEA